MPGAIKLLESDHREVEDLFAKAESTGGAEKQQVVTKLASELTLHAEVEETIVDPAMRQAGLTDIVDESIEEHAHVKDLIAKLEAMDGSSTNVDPTLTALKADVLHHVQEEESDGFPKFREAVGEDELATLGERVEQLKNGK
jgi:iron-sulfur cluster repair protein YtfE (RIC family)